VHAYKTYKFHDLENMFPNNLDPTFIDSTVQCDIAKSLKTMKMTPTVIGGAVVLVMVAAVAVFIVQKAFKGNISVQECESMIKAGGNAIKNPSETAAVAGSFIAPLFARFKK